MNINTKAWLSLVIFVVVLGLLLFVVAGTVRYWQAWLCLAVLAAASAVMTAYLIRHDPALLDRRMRAGPRAEKRPVQRLIMLIMTIAFTALFVVPALDIRFDWSVVPLSVVVLGDALIVAGFWIILLVYRENTFTSATIEIAAGQTVISTGPYAIVRHPMYVGAVLYLLGIPLALGSYWGVTAFAVIVALLLWRIVDEERLLATSLDGYAEYCKQVRYRLIPHVW
jgi:protein-S-isoprenylcysteine O-methyltransferase Ste14